MTLAAPLTHDQRKVLLLIGGSGGIGSAIWRIADQVGFEVIAPDRSQLNLADPNSIESYFSSRTDLVPDALVLAAGINRPQSLRELTQDNWRLTFEVNLNASFRVMQILGLRMASHGRGKIVALSSCYGVRSRNGRLAYSASKSALNSLVAGLALELAPQNVLVNGLAPGFVETDLTFANNDEVALASLRSRIPIGRLATPTEIAQIAIFLVGENNTYLTGQTIAADGGFLCQ